MSTFLTLNDNDLKELGITTFGARRRMLTAIAGTVSNTCCTCCVLDASCMHSFQCPLLLLQLLTTLQKEVDF
jgi:hypothetical protein